MKRDVNHSALAVAGYTTPWTVHPGELVSLHLSVGKPVRGVEIQRLDLPVPAATDWRIEQEALPAQRAFDQGSFLRIEASELAQLGRIQGISFELFLTRNRGRRTITEIGALKLTLEDSSASLERDGVALHSARFPERSWLTVCLAEADGCIALNVRGHDTLSPYEVSERFEDWAWPRWQGDVLLGTDRALSQQTLNAKFAAVSIRGDIASADWTFPTLLPSAPIPSSSCPPLLLQAVNQPTFCMTSRRWDGSSFEPRLVPSHYDAIHCHDDDAGPLDWPPSYTATIPRDAASGVYAFDVAYEGGSEQIVFFVSCTIPKARLLFVVPTATYLAYADEFLPEHLYEWKCEDRGQRFAVDNNLRSLYDYHSDLSGVSITSYRKPKATLRDDYRYPLCGCPHNLPVDLRLLRFCRHNGIALDVITDHDFHARAPDCLSGYAAVVTGSHPEYMSVEIEAAIRAFVADGGSLAYLGGNGFAGVVAFKDDFMELRRSPLEAVRTWDGPVSEQSLSITNQPGGPLRARGRGEFSLTGGAISLMGFSCATPFTRTPESYEAEHAWLFEGVEAATFGETGTVLGGAAGYEVDATDLHLGTSPDVKVIARASGFPDDFVHDPSRWYVGGEAEASGRRCAEMTVRHLASGGLIFSASSVAWCGALPDTGAMNDVGRITLTLLRRLADA